jgi:hypothetical protein
MEMCFGQKERNIERRKERRIYFMEMCFGQTY